MQGPAVAYDLAKFANPAKILLADLHLNIAQSKAERVNHLIGKPIVEPMQINAMDDAQVKAFFKSADMVISAVPWQMNMRLSELALECQTNFLDMGNEPDWFWYEFRKRNQEAVDAGISIVPDCGLAPGMVNHLGLYCMEKMDRCDSITLRCGGLPQEPKPPLGYKLVFNMIGVISEYTGEAHVLRDGKNAFVPTLDDVEILEDPVLGTLEAASTSGGTSTATYTLEGKVRAYDYKTLRYPGHWGAIRALRDLGFFEEQPVQIGETRVSPRDVCVAVIPPKIRFPEDKDLIVVHAHAEGIQNDRPYKISLHFIDYHDDETGFSAMERVTGFAASIIAQGIVNGQVPKGLIPYEQTMSGHDYLREFLRRGFRVRENVIHELVGH